MTYVSNKRGKEIEDGCGGTVGGGREPVRGNFKREKGRKGP